MSKSKLSLEDSITLAQNNAIDFTHACVTIALNEKFGIGKERQKKVNAVRDEVNGKVQEIMTRPASRKHEPLRKAEAWMHSQLPEGTVWELHIPMAKGRARSHKEWKMQGAVDSAATLEWRVCAIACAQVLGFGAEQAEPPARRSAGELPAAEPVGAGGRCGRGHGVVPAVVHQRVQD